MSTRRCLGLAVLLVCASLLPFHQEEAFSQEKTSKRLCPKCKSTGKLPSPFMTENLIELEKDVLFCSYVIEHDTAGHGIPWLPCNRCRNPDLEKAARKEFDKLVAQKMRWLEERKANVAFLKTRSPLIHVETEHFIITWNVPKIVTADKKTYKSHEALHLYATRLETFYADFLKTLGLKDEEMRNRKHLIYLFEDQKSCLKASQEFTGLNCWNAAKLPGNPSVLVSWKDITYLKTDDGFHRHVIHHVSHLLNVAYYLMEWLAVEAGWADEGLAHFFEMKYFQLADNTCDEEGEEEEHSASDWEFEVRKSLEAGKALSFADVSLKSTTALFGEEHKYAWSYVDFLMDRDPHKFKLFMKAIKTKKKCREALKESYGLNYISFQNEWEEYVLKNYRKKPLKPPSRPRRLR